MKQNPKKKNAYVIIPENRITTLYYRKHHTFYEQYDDRNFVISLIFNDVDDDVIGISLTMKQALDLRDRLDARILKIQEGKK